MLSRLSELESSTHTNCSCQGEPSRKWILWAREKVARISERLVKLGNAFNFALMPIDVTSEPKVLPISGAASTSPTCVHDAIHNPCDIAWEG